MVYATTLPPVRVAGSMAGPSIWIYTSANADSDVDAVGFFTNGHALGMRVGDILFAVQTDATYLVTLFSVTVSTAGGASTVVAGTVTV